MKDYKTLYENALERVKDFTERQNPSMLDKEIIHQIFPELRESEDERIRKAIFKALSKKDARGVLIENGIQVSDALAWLEKQGEQKSIEQDTEIRDLWVYIREWNEKFGRLPKDEDELASCIDYVMKRHKPTDEVKPKFKVGDWITNGEYTWKITDIKPLDYILQSPNGDVVDDAIFYVDEEFHLWTIQDAKDGDVLNSTRVQATVIFKGFNHDCKHIDAYCALQSGIFIHQEMLWDMDFEPAPKVLENKLFEAIKEAGYEWNAEKKELKKIEQKLSCSEEDEKMIDTIIYDLERHGGKEDSSYSAEINWLKELKERVQPHPKQEWNKEDSERLDRIYKFIWANRKGDTDEIYQQEQDADWLMTLKPQPEQEWSVEDDYVYNEILKRVANKKLYEHDLEYIYTWLKSLKLQTHWKPSKEQMVTLNEWLKNHQYDGDSRYCYPIFQSLYNDLKTLI